MMWTINGSAVMRGQIVVKQCANAVEAEAYVRTLESQLVEEAAKVEKKLPPWLMKKGAKPDDEPDADENGGPSDKDADDKKPAKKAAAK